MKTRQCFLLFTVFHLFSCFALLAREEVRLRTETRLCCELPVEFQAPVSFESRQFANDAFGATYVTGNTFIAPDDEHYDSWDIVTFKFDSAGHGVWTNRYDGFGRQDFPSGLTVDSSGNVYVIGISQCRDCSPTIVVLKYAPDGAPVWTNLHFFGYSGAAAVDRAGNVAIVGLLPSGPPSYQYEPVIVKYNSAGLGLWTNHIAAGGRYLAAASDGSFVFIGSSITNGLTTTFIAKYSPGGTPLWTNHLTSDTWYEWLAGLTIDSKDNAVVLFSTSLSTPYAVLYGGYSVKKYSPEGALVWTNSFVEAAAESFPQAIITDERDAIYVAGILAPTGPSSASSDPAHFTTIKFSSEGTLRWTSSTDFGSGFFNFADTPLRFISANPHEVVLGQDYGSWTGGVGEPSRIIENLLLFEYFQPPRSEKADR